MPHEIVGSGVVSGVVVGMVEAEVGVSPGCDREVVVWPAGELVVVVVVVVLVWW